MPKVHISDANIPRMHYNGRDCYDWKRVENVALPFVYDDLCGELLLVGAAKSQKGDYMVEVRYGDGPPHHLRSYDLIQGHIGSCIGVNTRRHKYAAGQRLADGRRDLTVTRVYKAPIDKNGTRGKMVAYHCNRCGYDNPGVRQCAIDRGTGCSVCAGKLVVAGFNDIPTTAPWMVPFFPGGAAEAGLYTQSSGRAVLFRCPSCGASASKPMPVATLHSTHSIGCPCGDGISFPEKFIFYLFRALGVEGYVRQAGARLLPWCQGYRYDGLLFYGGATLLVEVHGLQHFEETGFKKFTSQTLAAVRENDLRKRQLALDNGVLPEHYIELDCRQSTLAQMKRAVLASPLAAFFSIDTKNVPWEAVFEQSLGSTSQNILRHARQHPRESTKYIALRFGVSQGHVARVLIEGGIYGKEEQKQRKDKTFFEENRARMLARLAGLIAENPHDTVRQLSEKLGRTPAAIHRLIRSSGDGIDVAALRENGERARLEGHLRQVGRPVLATAPDGQAHHYASLSAACRALSALCGRHFPIASVWRSIQLGTGYHGFVFCYLSKDDKE